MIRAAQTRPLRAVAVLNTDSGTLCDSDCNEVSNTLRRAFTENGHSIRVHLLAGKDFSQAINEATADPEVDLLVAGGGDGTVSGAAALAWKAKKALAILPGGTMNLFARSLRMPLDLDAAIEAIVKGHLRPIDIATANGRPYLHQYAVGLHPLMIRTRNAIGYGSRPSKILASLRAAASITWDPPAFTAILDMEGETIRERVSALSISTVPFGTGHMPYADRLDPGHLGVYTARPLEPIEALRLGKDVMLGTWGDNECVTQRKAQALTLTCEDVWDDAHATIDGEIVALNEPVRIENHPSALKVMFPG